MAQINKIKIRRGLEANLPAGATEEGELRYSTDTKQLYIDDGTNNVLLATNEVASNMNTAVESAINLKQNSFPGISEKTPILAEDITIDTSNRILTITPPLGYFDFFVGGSGTVTKYTKTGAVSFPVFNDTTGLWYFYFDSSGNPQVSQSVWTDFNSVVPVYRIYWNSTLIGSAKLVVEVVETHLNTISADDHVWKHKNGTIWLSGFDAIHNRLTTGTPNANGSNTVFSLTTGKNMDDNLEYTVTNGTGTSKFEQNLGNTSAGSLNATNSALFEIRTNDAGGLLQILPATRFPFPWDSSTNRPEYITTGGVRTLVSSAFFVSFVYALQEPRNGKSIKIIPAFKEFTTLTNAQAFIWEDLQAVYPTVADNEIRPLYKLIFEYKSSYSVGCKYSVLRQVDDLRKTRVTTSSTASGAMLATNVIVTPSGTLSSTNAQSALLELDTEKVAKVTASDNAITRFDGTLGDIQSSLATISDTGSIDIPTDQNFTINAVPLKNVAETLTNKTINSPTITGTPTGITATHVGLGNVANVDTSNPANITWTSSHRTVTDTEKTTWNEKVSSSDVVTTATANKILKLDANAKLPANITGNADGNATTATKLQTVRTINGVNFDGSENITINAVDSISRIASTEKGAINGVATLDSAGKVPASQLPSYVDDVLEYASFAGFPATGEASKIYVDLATNKCYRWGGSAYVYITSGAVDSVNGKTGVVILAKADVGLGNVTDNAQVKKVTSSTDNAIMRWDGATGDLPKNSLATISNTGTINIPTGQNYNINGVALKDVSETLTYKTLTAPVLNTEITGTGITTTGEANKLFKFSSTANTALHELALKKSSTTALRVQDDSGTDVFNVDTTNKVATVSGTLVNYGDITLKTSHTATDQGKRILGIPVYGSVTPCYIEFRRDNNLYDGREGRIIFATNNAASPSPIERMHISGVGAVNISSLAGTGVRMVAADSSGNLSANGFFSLKTYITATVGTPVIVGDINTFRANSIYEISVTGKTSALAGEYKKIMLHTDADGNPYYRTIITGGTGISVGIGGTGQFAITVSVTGDYIVLITNM